MNIIKKSNSDEVVLEWLKAELNSERFSPALKNALQFANKNESIITTANLTDDTENRDRLSILKLYRDWIDVDFETFKWEWVELNQADVDRLKYIDYSYWNELSDNTRLVQRAVANIVKSKIVFGVPHDRFHSVAEAVKDGMTLPPIIIVRNAEDDSLKILEGHLRATGYALASQKIRPLSALIGTSIKSNILTS